MSREDPRRSKLWHDPTFPKRGWILLGVEDTGEPSSSCCVCGTEIRYEFSLRHPGYGKLEPVGCICAGYLLGDIPLAQHEQDKVAKAAKFSVRKRWKPTKSGGWWIKDEGMVLLVFRRPKGGFGVGVKWETGAEFKFGDKTYSTELDAKAGAYLAKLYMEEQRNRWLLGRAVPSAGWVPPLWHR